MNPLNTIKQSILEGIKASHPSKIGIRTLSIKPYPDNIDILECVSGSTCPSLRYIKSKAPNTERLVLGICQEWTFSWNDYNNAKQTLTPYIKEGFNIYTTATFQPLDKNKDEFWDPLKDITMIIPAIEIIKSDQGITVTGYCPEEQLRDSKRIEAYMEAALSYQENKNTRITPITRITKEETPSYLKWEEDVTNLLSLMHHSTLQKLILARKTSFNCNEHINAYQLLISQIENEPNCNVYFQKIDAETTFLSVTPERLYTRQNKLIQCDAIAGTTSKGYSNDQTQDLAIALLSSKKNQEEHQFVVDFLIDTLAPLCHCITNIKEKEILELGQVQHIHSLLNAELNNEITDFELLLHLHPTPATGGFPKEKGIPLIKNYESFNRGLYTGVLGMMSDDFSEFFVGIRSCLIRDKTLTIFTGAGIVQDSKPLEEWQELNIKMESYVSMINEPSYHK